MDNGKKIAVIGTGVAGLTAAYILRQRHNITLFERNDYAGGHTHTIILPEGPDAGTPVDTGFIVMNHRNYPLFTRLLNKLDVELRDSDMSFSFYDQKSGLQYSGSNLNGLFAQRRNIINPRFLKMLLDIKRFFSEARAQLNEPELEVITLGDFLKAGNYSDAFINDHIIPMGAAIWSTPCNRMLEFPAASFLRFFNNHGLLSIKDRPQWRTVKGGSHQYVKKILSDFKDALHLNTPVSAVTRHSGGVTVTPHNSEPLAFDEVIIATHADEAYRMLADPSPLEEELLSPWSYQNNHTVLHRDSSVMPPIPRAWASWNFTREACATPASPLALSYDMIRLQGLITAKPLFVSLNRSAPYSPVDVIREMNYMHPVYTRKALKTQHELHNLNGQRNTYFCGSYFGHGFHEDAVKSAVNVAAQHDLTL